MMCVYPLLYDGSRLLYNDWGHTTGLLMGLLMGIGCENVLAAGFICSGLPCMGLVVADSFSSYLWVKEVGGIFYAEFGNNRPDFLQEICSGRIFGSI
jgi:hypothetical protein